MIFRRTLSTQATSGAVQPAFEAIAATQTDLTAEDWFVSQVDHARLSGDLAAAIAPYKVPNVSKDVVEAIRLHDMGWMPYDGAFKAPMMPKVGEDGRVISFVNGLPETVLSAWTGSIQTAQSTGPLGGLLVSAHFARLAQLYVQDEKYSPELRAKAEQFVLREAQRVDRQLAQVQQPEGGEAQNALTLEEIEQLLWVLQFCDLASLYICANPTVPVEMPMSLGGGQLQMRYENGSFRVQPGILDNVVILEIPCLRHKDGRFDREIVPVKVQ